MFKTCLFNKDGRLGSTRLCLKLFFQICIGLFDGHLHQKNILVKQKLAFQTPRNSPARRKKKKGTTIFLNPIRRPIFLLETGKINYEAVAEMKAEAPCDLKVAFDWIHYKGEE